MDIKKYITNKDIEITNDDINIDKLTNDLRKGYVSNDDMEAKIKSSLDEVNKTSSAKYEELEKKYNTLQDSYTEIEKRNTDLADRNKTLGLENVMTKEGFKEEDFKDVSTMRYSLYGEEKDDIKAIQSIKEKYKNTYFPQVETPKAKDDLPINNGVKEPTEIKVTRNTSIKDMLIKK